MRSVPSGGIFCMIVPPWATMRRCKSTLGAEEIESKTTAGMWRVSKERGRGEEDGRGDAQNVMPLKMSETTSTWPSGAEMDVALLLRLELTAAFFFALRAKGRSSQDEEEGRGEERGAPHVVADRALVRARAVELDGCGLAK